MARSFQDAITVLNAVTRANTADPVWVKVSDFRHLIFSIFTSASASCTIKVIGSVKSANEGTTTEAPPALGSAASVTNQYCPIAVFDLNTGTIVVGTTGVVLTGTDVQNLYMVNTDGLAWLTIQVTAYAAGTITATLKPFNDAV